MSHPDDWTDEQVGDIRTALDKAFDYVREHTHECPACHRRTVLDIGPAWCRNCGWNGGPL
jgi:ribosomal protein L37AE/L43A